MMEEAAMIGDVWWKIGGKPVTMSAAAFGSAEFADFSASLAKADAALQHLGVLCDMLRVVVPGDDFSKAPGLNPRTTANSNLNPCFCRWC